MRPSSQHRFARITHKSMFAGLLITCDQYLSKKKWSSPVWWTGSSSPKMGMKPLQNLSDVSQDTAFSCVKLSPYWCGSLVKKMPSRTSVVQEGIRCTSNIHRRRCMAPKAGLSRVHRYFPFRFLTQSPLLVRVWL
jgi:hypothetical protein